MNVFHFIIGKANKERANGVNQVIAGLCKYTAINGENVKVIGLASNSSEEGEVIERDGFEVEVYTKWSSKLLAALITQLKWCDVLHLHGVYNWSNILVGKIANRFDVPYVVTPHNGFSPSMAKVRKKLFDIFLQRRFLESAIAVHVLAQEEATEILDVCAPSGFIYAPNGIDLEDFVVDEMPSAEDGSIGSKNRLTIGYLGRFSEEKNLLSLVDAVSNFELGVTVVLKLAGPDSPYLAKVLGHNRAAKIAWVGPKFGREKIEFLRSVDLFIHPSKTDVFSISAMECLAVGTPLVISREAKSAHFYTSGGFFMCEATPFGISTAIENALERRGEWGEISQRGRGLVLNTFNWNAASVMLIRGYKAFLWPT